MRSIPGIEVRLDASIEYGDKIEKLIKEIRKKDEGSS